MSVEKQREEIARRYGFEHYADLLDASDPLPLTPGDKVRCYVARRPGGNWFIWEDPTQPLPQEDTT